ncbi:MAG: KxYKxGKxW signal peptide domain-containing protein [Lactobacillus sp.]|jgi:LPXTG-motif cell wall-anchored protein|nr:KxYKxGKxW signal peptide domain-containing protein [Lactobacillus sp.]MCI1917175.1 KxYKxGKxW signal peptide domain-containing protein [Lactobacillus sp.]MCI1942031.1 KxYKxGKxW signal peptide domain-containing protein [Lactobacillus sp.]MCI1972362.1 KxYKxGKxW signal peptide domain-containing protein [Lactobacillus sp.]MCI2016720.1 KxYKxGKxW signal peptide domain-containing protein [Lactobacillus sp.]
MDKSIKIRFKMYKAGRRWLVAAAAVAAFSVGTALATGQGVNAATTDSTSGTTTAATAPAATADATASTAAQATTAATPEATATPTATTQTPESTPTTDNTTASTPTTATAPTTATTTATPTKTTTAAAPTATAIAVTPQATAKAAAATTTEPAIQQTNTAGDVQPAVDPSNGAITSDTGVTLNAWLSAENADGTTSTTGYNASQGLNQIASTAKNVQLHYEISNTTGSDIANVSAQLYLPPTGQNNVNGTANGPTFTITSTIYDIENQIHQAGYTSNYSEQGNVIWPGHWYDASHFVANFDLQQLSRIWYSIGTLEAGAKLDVVIDLTLNDTPTANTGVSNVSQFAIQDSTTPGSIPTAYYSLTTPTPAPVTIGRGSVSTSIGATGNQATSQFTTEDATDNVAEAQTQVNYADVNDLSASFTIGNPTSAALNIRPVILLPIYNDNNSKWVLDASKVTEATFEDALPGLTVKYSKDGDDGNYMTYAELMAAYPDFTWDQLQSIWIDGPVAANTNYTVNLPMIYTGTKAGLATAGVGQIGVLDYDMTDWSDEDIFSTASLVTYSYGSATSTRTINFVNADGTTAKDPVVQTINYKTVTNDQTGETIYTPQGAYYQYDVPEQAGYTADQTTIAQQAVDATNVAPENTAVTVTYTPKMTYGTATSTRTIHFVDAEGNVLRDPVEQTIAYKTATNAVTGDTIYTPQNAYYQYDVPAIAGYNVDTNQIAQETVKPGTAVADNTDVTVTYTPKMTYGTATSTRTIHFVDASGKELRDPVVQTITYKTVTNAVTGETVYTPQGAYYAYHVPTIAGYHTDATVIAQLAVGASATAPEAIDVAVTYTKDAAVVTPAQPSTKPSVATTTKPATGSKTTTKVAAQAAAKKLPKTGDEANASIALLGSALIALVGVAGYRKRV